MQNATLKKEKPLYEAKGQQTGAVGAIITLIVGVGVSVLVLIFVGSLGGQTYELVESDIDAITNTTISNSIKDGIVSGFEAMEQTGDYLPIIVLAVVISLVLALVLGFTAFGGGRGSAL
jgi:high-affinity Fe2+/Pb2+ permease